jgi:hypothetical protein
MTLSTTILCHYAECRYAGWRVLFIVELNVIMLSVMTPEMSYSVLFLAIIQGYCNFIITKIDKIAVSFKFYSLEFLFCLPSQSCHLLALFRIMQSVPFLFAPIPGHSSEDDHAAKGKQTWSGF